MNLGRYKIEILGIAATILVAGFFYFYNITQKGFFYYDEAFYMLNANHEKHEIFTPWKLIFKFMSVK